MFASLLVVAYAWLELTLSTRTRIWVAIIAVATYFLVRKMTTQVLMDLMRRRPDQRA